VLNLIRDDNQPIQMNAGDVVRVRQTAYIDGPNGHSRIDDAITGSNLYNDVAQTVAAAVAQEVHSFISLTQPGGDPVWFDGAKATGPTFVSRAQQTPDWSGRINSALVIGQNVQFVRNTPQEVYEAINGQHGHAIPPRRDEFAIDVLKDLETDGTKIGVWDESLYLKPGA